MRKYILIILIIISIPLLSCACSIYRAFSSEGNYLPKRHVTVNVGDNYLSKFAKPNTIYEISNDLNLGGIEITVGSNSVLKFIGGSISNGIIVGAETRIEGDIEGIFNAIHCKGTWRVSYISTAMWKSLNYINSLKDVFSLQSSDLQNTLVINNEGYDYLLEAEEKEGILTVLDNVDLIINGNIALRPNGFQNYEMICVSGCNNVIIRGNGSVSGDRMAHDYTSRTGTHEYGHCFVFRSCKNVEISGIMVNNLTGDALCLMDNCSGFKIHDMQIKDCRRCGISIRADHDITIDNCTFSGIINDKYNEPSAAIDIEPVVDCKVYNINIKNCKFNNIVRGISSNARNYYGKTYKKGNNFVNEGRQYVNLSITNCRFENSTYTSFIAPFGWEKVTIRGCTFLNGRQEDIRVAYVGDCVIKDCITNCNNGTRASQSRSFVTTFYDNKSIRVEDCTGDNVKRIFSDNKNCKLIRSEFKTR